MTISRSSAGRDPGGGLRAITCCAVPAPPELGSFTPTRSVSVVVPAEAQASRLLAHQSYPLQLIDVVAVDNVQAARGEIVLWMPCLSGREGWPARLVEAHVRWHHVATNLAVTHGDRRGAVSPADLAAVLPSAASGVSATAESLEIAGGAPTLPGPAGGIELAWRLHTTGCRFVTDPAAGRGRTGSEGSVDLEPALRLAVENTVPALRSARSGRLAAVPRMLVELDASNTAPDTVRAVVEGVLASTPGDLALVVRGLQDPDLEAYLHAASADDPRIASQAGGTPPAHPELSVRLPADVVVGPESLDTLHRQLVAHGVGTVMALVSSLDDAPLIVEARATWAWSCAARMLRDAATQPVDDEEIRTLVEETAGEWWLRAADIGISAPNAPENAGRAPTPDPHLLRALDDLAMAQAELQAARNQARKANQRIQRLRSTNRELRARAAPLDQRTWRRLKKVYATPAFAPLRRLYRLLRR